MATKKQSAQKSTSENLTPESAFGLVILERRKELGYTQSDLEAITQIGRSYISELENGSKQVCLRSLVKLAYALDLTPDVLLANVIARISSDELRALQPQK